MRARTIGPQRLGQQDLALVSTLAEDVELHAPVVWTLNDVAAVEADQLRDAQPGGVGHSQHHAVTRTVGASNDVADIELPNDALGEASDLGTGLDGDTGIEGHVAQAMRVAEEGPAALRILPSRRGGVTCGDLFERPPHVLHGGLAQCAAEGGHEPVGRDDKVALAVLRTQRGDPRGDQVRIIAGGGRSDGYRRSLAAARVHWPFFCNPR